MSKKRFQTEFALIKQINMVHIVHLTRMRVLILQLRLHLSNKQDVVMD